jgi:hypothetical protein
MKLKWKFLFNSFPPVEKIVEVDVLKHEGLIALLREAYIDGLIDNGGKGDALERFHDWLEKKRKE